MRELHPDVAHTAKEMIIKENPGFRLRMEKWEAVNPKGLYAIDLIQEIFNKDGEVESSSTYNFHMTSDELKTLAYALTV
jgi:hypothetical protein